MLSENYDICTPASDEAEMLDDKLLEEIQKKKQVTLKEAFAPINVTVE